MCRHRLTIPTRPKAFDQITLVSFKKPLKKVFADRACGRQPICVDIMAEHHRQQGIGRGPCHLPGPLDRIKHTAMGTAHNALGLLGNFT